MIAMTLATKSLATLIGRVARVAARPAAAVSSFVRAVIHRRDVMRLTELDERGLKDIGLVRSDIDGALAVSWLDDPSTVLAARSAQQNGAAAQRREVAARRASSQDAPRQPDAGVVSELACRA